VQRFTPPPEYRAYWDWLVGRFIDCGLAVKMADFDAVEWYTAPFIPKRIVEFQTREKYPAAARMWGVAFFEQGRAPRIVLLDSQAQNGTLVRHEATHVIGRCDHASPHYHTRFLNVL
jgi:hypothetical protein